VGLFSLLLEEITILLEEITILWGGITILWGEINTITYTDLSNFEINVRMRELNQQMSIIQSLLPFHCAAW
jgi:hypothetical protein